MNNAQKAQQLVNFISSMSNFEIVKEIDGNYNHIGATIVDAILQAGINYKYTVKPRVNSLLQKYPEAITTQDFVELINEIGLDKLINWKHPEKLNRILSVLDLFIINNVKNELDLKKWLKVSTNIIELKKIKGIGDKTADYFKILVGIETNAVDRHLHNFLKMASIKVNSYNEAHEIINDASLLMNINPAYLDHSIWKYMSEKK